MKRIGKMVGHLIWIVNAVCTGLMILVAFSPMFDPTVHPIRSTLGLAFPVFLVINIAFIIFWLIVYWKFALLSIAGLLICCLPLRTYMPFNISARKVPEQRIKFLSYNVMGFNHLVKKDGKNDILEYISQSNADIVCLQEYLTSQNTKYVTDKDVFAALSSYPYHHIQQIGEGKKSGNKIACFSRYPILSARMIPQESRYNGSVLYQILVEEDTITVINNHLESNKLTIEDKALYEDMIKSPEADKVKEGMRHLVRKLADASAIRAVQVQKVAKEIEATQTPYLIVCGDFNDSPISYTHKTLTKNLKDAFVESGNGLGISYNQNKFYFRIDHILISPNLKSYRCTVDRSIKESDHYPIWCYITRK